MEAEVWRGADRIEIAGLLARLLEAASATNEACARGNRKGQACPVTQPGNTRSSN